MPRFSILAHDYPAPHWDLFLEADGCLRSWRLLAPLQSDATVIAEPIGDHRLIYLDYEGPVSGERGHVRRVDSGTFAWLADDADHVIIQLAGGFFRGRLCISVTAAGCVARFDPDACSF